MVRKFKFDLLLCVLVISTVTFLAGCSQMNVHSTGGANNNRIRLEHVAINVENPVSMAKWYSHHLGMKVVRKGPPPINMHFISDAGGNMMLEIYHNPPDAVPDYASMDPLLLHISFMVDDVKDIREKLIAAGATAVGEITVTPAGDELAMLRDPWGVAIQFVKRAKPMLRH
ncbi:MAG: VOC family protein [Planctomycetota bacterium]|jgi:catechol 2,3-dioxygenase-like lactoylglutathione lyase family enzyme